MQIIITTLVILVIGFIVGYALVLTDKKFHVDTDEREQAIRDALPGNNCGACGQAGCDAMAAAMFKGEAPLNGCPVGGASVAQMIGQIMGVDVEAAVPKAAFVRCSGCREVTRDQGRYVGIMDCRAAVQAGLNVTSCVFGCIGLGSCQKACPHDAIVIQEGLAHILPQKCVGCGLCVKTCPRALIELKPRDRQVAVRCMSHDRGPLVKKVCTAGCIGCGLCEKVCESGAIKVEGNVASVNYELCTQCGKCAEKCPSKVITLPRSA
ncbi:MAG: RnfABCDGE type electron transport complex subunit B [Clostridia bacterium]|nr:RnfABCDGE type electron transport complex subunit B [Clostridia bacterium]